MSDDCTSVGMTGEGRCIEPAICSRTTEHGQRRVCFTHFTADDYQPARDLPLLVPAHMCDQPSRGSGFCGGGEKIQPNGRCQYGCEHADHYSNDGHPECVDTSGEPR